jgi:hypothetical protein
VSTLERRLHDALIAGADVVEPAPDLFSRVQGSIQDDRRRRSQRRRGAAVVALLGVRWQRWSSPFPISKEGGF